MGEQQPWESFDVNWLDSSDPDEMPGDIEKLLGNQKWSTKKGYVYVIESPGGHLVKIGKTINLQKRFEQLQKLTRGRVRLLFYVPSMDAYDNEMRLHDRFHRQRKIGEWFALNDDDMNYLIEIMTIYRYQTEVVLEHMGAK